MKTNQTFGKKCKKWCKKLLHFWYDTITGIKNVIAWLPIIWKDREWDYVFFCMIMEFKCRRMSKFYKEHGSLVGSDRTSRQLLICAELLKRIADDDLDLEHIKFDEMKRRYYVEYLTTMIRKHIRTWWD